MAKTMPTENDDTATAIAKECNLRSRTAHQLEGFSEERNVVLAKWREELFR